MVWGILASVVVVVHAAFVLFVVLGGLVVARWGRVGWAHVPAVVWAVAIEWRRAVCPLTPLENRLRQLAGASGYSEDFLQRYVLSALYPAGLTRESQVALGVAVVAVNAVGLLVGVASRSNQTNCRIMDSSPADVPKHPGPVHRMTRQMVGRRVCTLLALCVVVALSACGAGGENGGGPARARANDPASRRAVSAPDTAPTRAPEAPRIVVLGDSLTAGLGLPVDLSFPARLQATLDEAGYPHEIVNAGESGGTSAGGLRRLERSLEGDVRVLVLALGANDGLRGLAVDEMKANLAEIIQTARARGVAVLLAGMEAPPNLGSNLHDRLPRRVPRPFRGVRHGVRAVSAGRRRRCRRAEPGGRDASERRGGHYGRGPSLAGARAAAGRRSDAMIELRGVSKTVTSGDRPLTILHPLDLFIPSGQCVSIVGPSGSGKSTLLGLIAGLDAPTTGEILIDGVEITTLSEDALASLRGSNIGFVFQFFHLIPSLTAFENILVPLEIAGVTGAREKAEGLLQEVGLEARASHYPSQLSGGEQQRIAIARALANDPPILLADEPTGNLDSVNGHHVVELLLEVNRRRGTTVVLVTHDTELAEITEVTLLMRDGRTERRQAAPGEPASREA